MALTPTDRKKIEIKARVKTMGFVEDRWGNFKKESDGKQYRFKFQKTSVRFETKVNAGWVNLLSDYYKNILVENRGVVIKGKIVNK